MNILHKLENVVDNISVVRSLRRSELAQQQTTLENLGGLQDLTNELALRGDISSEEAQKTLGQIKNNADAVGRRIARLEQRLTRGRGE